MSPHHKWEWISNYHYNPSVSVDGYWRCEKCRITHFGGEKPHGKKMYKKYGFPSDCNETLITKVMES